MATSYQNVEWYPIGGLNTEDSARKLSLNEAAQSNNFLFQQKKIRTRPGITSGGASVAIGNAVPNFARGFTNAGVFTNLVISSNLLYQLPSVANGAGAAALTGPAPVFGAGLFHNAELVNGVILIANNTTGGMLRWDPTGGVYTALAGVPYRYVTGLLSRAVAAYDPTTSAALGSRTVAWSVAGDETTWTGSTNGSGLAVLSDIPDYITGLTTINNVLVICRAFGFHLGFETGIAFPAFRFQKFSNRGPGVFIPRTLVSDQKVGSYSNNIIYFCGNDDVYSFDLVSVKSIGGKMRGAIIAAVNSGNYIFRGVLTRTIRNGTPRTLYHLWGHPAVGGVAVVHFVYDTVDDVWSQHSYPSLSANSQGAPWNGFDQTSSSAFGLSFFSTPAGGNAQPYFWDDSVAIQDAASITSGTLQVGELTADYTLERLLISALEGTGGNTVSLIASCDLAGTVNSVNANVVLPSSTLWQRQFVDIGRLVGNGFQIQVSAGNGKSLTFDSILAILAREAQFRG